MFVLVAMRTPLHHTLMHLITQEFPARWHAGTGRGESDWKFRFRAEGCGCCESGENRHIMKVKEDWQGDGGSDNGDDVYDVFGGDRQDPTRCQTPK